MVQKFNIAIVGSGFAGLGTAIKLKRAGIDDFVVLERASDVGGVWRDNSYPGCACDIESHLYSFSFALNSKWTRMFAGQQEIWAYLRKCAEDFKIRSHIKFENDLLDALWDEKLGSWQIKTSKGDLEARILIAGMGALSDPALPQISGIEKFKGTVFHSAQWNHNYDLTGRKVAVVGTGASAIQFVPQIQPKVGQLLLFQRTPPWILPRMDRPITDLEVERCEKIPFYKKLWRLRLFLTHEMIGISFRHPKFMGKAKSISLRHLKRAIKDPSLREKLTPTYEMGCKRILLSNDYYPALAQTNVSVITDSIEEIRTHSIVTKNGAEHKVDAMILGTGFQVTDFPGAKRIRRQDGVNLKDSLGDSPRAFLGTTFPGFPNFFMLQGPNTGLGHNSVIIMLEAQIDLIFDAVKFLSKKATVAITPKRRALERFVEYVDRKTRGTVWIIGGCKSWYLDKTMRNSSLWPASVGGFLRMAKFRSRDYDISMPGNK